MRVSEPKNPARRAGTLSAVVAVMATLAACGGSKSPTTPTPAPTPTPPAPTSRTTQNPLGSATNVEARTSQIIPGQNVPTAQVFDDFVFTGGANIRTLAWQGIYCVETANAPAPAPTATAFVLSFYADQGGRPNTGSPLFSTTVPVGQAAETLDRTQANLNCGTTPTTWAFYSYAATLPNAFGATAGTRYWFSVQAVTPSFATFWGWRDGTPDNASSLQLVNGSFLTFSIDRAYSLAP